LKWLTEEEGISKPTVYLCDENSLGCKKINRRTMFETEGREEKKEKENSAY